MTALNKTILSGLIAAAFAGSTLTAHAASCVKPAQPVIPEGATANGAQLSKVPDKLDAYIAAMNVYLACLEQSDSQARAEAEALLQKWQQTEQDHAAQIEVVVE